MTKYELILIVKPNLTEADFKSLLDKVEGYLPSGEGRFLERDTWGKRRLAYPIDHNTEGFYAVLNFEAVGNASGSLGEKLSLESDLIRYMITKVAE